MRGPAARTSLLAAVSGLAAVLTSSSVAAQTTTSPSCQCGYYDSVTDAIWTDRSITYFNETDARSNVVWQPPVSPSFEGINSAGDTGNGIEDWAVGDHLNDWEDGFGATWLSGSKANNTYLPDNQVNGLAMAVTPADRAARTSWGSLLVSRRRDILYGSFRAGITPPSTPGSGTLVRMAAWYNQSQDLVTNIVTTDAQSTAFLQWDYSATGRDSRPVNSNLTSGDFPIGFQPREHRIDWLPKVMRWSNSVEGMIPYEQIFDDRGIFIPSVAMPVSFRHYSNGDSRLMEGPPLKSTPVTTIKYVRLFFNSSLPGRQQEFESACANTREQLCDVDDISLRASTEFSMESIQQQIPPAPTHTAPLYSKIITSASGGLFIIIFIHAMARRFINKRKKEAEYMTQLREGEKQYNLSILQQPSGFNTPTPRDINTPVGSIGYNQRSIRGGVSPDGSETPRFTAGNVSLHSGARTPGLPYGASEYATSVGSFDTKYDDADALAKWDDPRFMRDSDSESSDDDDDIKDDPLNPIPRSLQADLHSFGHGAFTATSGAMSPSGTSIHHGTSYIAPEYRINNGRSVLSHSHSNGFLSAANSVRNFPTEEEGGEEGSQQRHSGSRSFNSRPRPPLSVRLGRSVTDTWDVSSNDGALSVNGIALTPDNRRGSVSNSLRTQDMPGLSSAERNRWAGGLGGIGAPDSEVGHSSVGHWDQNRRPSFLRDGQSFVSLEGREHPVRWETKIMDWKPLDASADGQQGGQLAAPASGKNPLPERSHEPAAKKIGRLARFWKSMLVGEGDGKATASGAARVEYLDGLRGFACFLVSFHHFMLIFYYHATTPAGQAHYLNFENYFHFILGPILVNGGLNVGIFFVLSARVIANRYLVRGRLQDLAEATYRRVPRLAVPISAAIIINYFLIQAQAFSWIRKLASRTWSTWSYYHDYDNVGFFLNSWMSLWFVTPPDVPLLISTYATGILWTVPIIVQTSWTIFTCALIAREFNNNYKRYAFYSFCLVLSWWNNRFDYFFIAGLMIADADNKLKYRAAAAKGVPLVPSFMRGCLPKGIANARVHGQVFAWAVFLAGAVTSWLYFIGEEFHDENGDSLYGAMFNQLEWGVHPNYATAQPFSASGGKPTYVDPRLHDFFFVIGFFLLCDLCQSFRTFFQLRAWNFLGRNAFSLYLCHGVAFWSWGAWSCLQLLKAGVPYWATVTIVFITSYIILFIMCECFTRTFDVWGIGLSKSIWRAQSGGLGRRV
ncbi:unnamed protein product [Tilletia controversa]|uniref:Acyltransferase 3 domain-containing protein n=3 Tax=Tilletia TaxID=13289 RepID=A0A8X7MMR7_9BASI|nr:hypothetical protein CF336_g7223 [Tilletia laevis]KAE8241220.1 hypothetical protein A4X06_0g7619 [Tilletia controversa]KAE8249758.1 hypothetical protein A4X03_0g6562 [Tilletia caries]KAE8189467.1 hypothetical protein CF335_g6620 [Tilletia laevis]CAD6900522.1 unnamed protein product [Tilletia laevis]